MIVQLSDRLNFGGFFVMEKVMGDNLRIEYMFSDLIDELILSNDFGMLDDMDPAFLAEVLKRAILLLRSLRGVEKNG